MGRILAINWHTLLVAWVAISFAGSVAVCSVPVRALNQTPHGVTANKWSQHIQLVLDATEPLQFERGNRLPLYLWHAMDPGLLDPNSPEELLNLLNARGIDWLRPGTPRSEIAVCKSRWR